jgi:tetratricopeptide (TPR) repeat protein
MRPRALGLALLALLTASTAWAVREWYDSYLEARGLVKEGKCAEAIPLLQEAVRLKPNPALNEQTYGLQFVDYTPYYYLGLCNVRTGDFNTAMRMFNIEEDRGPIKKSALYKDLLRLRGEAEAAERQRVARLAREEVTRLQREAEALWKARKHGEARTRLAQAEAIATNLVDAETERSIRALKDKISADEKEGADAASRDNRVEQTLGEARRLLDEGRATEAAVHFEEVLALDPRNARALDGKRESQELILASRSQGSLDAAFQQGKALFETGKYEEALRPLTDAAADPKNTQAREMLQKAQSVVEGVRRQQELRIQIDGLLSGAEKLLAVRRFPEAQVELDRLLQLDPGNVRAAERRDYALKMTGEALIIRFLPNQAPALTFFEPRATELEVQGPTVAVVGVASDDRGIDRIEFRVGGRLVSEQVPESLPTGDRQTNVKFGKEFALAPGANEVMVAATDSSGVQRSQSFHLTRRLRFWETAAFLPSALAGAVGLIAVGAGAQRARRRRAVRRRFNPYIAGAPVLDDSMFFGRQRLMNRILNVLHHNSLMITGERRIGKTTFLYHLKRALETDDQTEYQFFPVFTDLQGVPESAFFHAVMGDVVEALSLRPETLQSLHFRPDHESYDGRDFSHDLQRVIEDLKTRTPKRVKLALLIDEVDVLNEYSERINQRLRSIFMKTFSENLVAIMSGVGIKRIWKSEGSPWYNFFDEVELHAFSREEAEALIRTPVQGVFRFEPEAVERILELSQLKPYLIQKFCVHAVNWMLEQGRTRVKASDVEAVRDAVRLDDTDHEEPAPAGVHEAPAGSVAD